jgi:hypothetical protein
MLCNFKNRITRCLLKPLSALVQGYAQKQAKRDVLHDNEAAEINNIFPILKRIFKTAENHLLFG